jgi:PAS domain S-box-containing protein
VLKTLQQKQISESHKQLDLESQAILDQIPLGLLVSDRHMNVKWVNKEMAAMLGLEVEQMIGKTWYDLVPS